MELGAHRGVLVEVVGLPDFVGGQRVVEELLEPGIEDFALLSPVVVAAVVAVVVLKLYLLLKTKAGHC